MADGPYDKTLGSEDRSAVAGTKMWAVVLGIVFLLGVGMLILFFVGGNSRGSGGLSSENTSTRPAEP